MNTKSIIACLDLANGRVVKGINFINLRDAGDPVENAKAYCDLGADEIAFLDINATNENRKSMLNVIERAAKVATRPITFGGGIKTVQDFQDAVNAGADKVSINTAAFINPDLITECAMRFGREKVIVAIDTQKDTDGKYKVFTHGGKVNTKADALGWAVKCEKFGAGGILPTSIDRDGEKSCYDIEITRAIAKGVKIPVIASGGAGTMQHFYEALCDDCGASAALAASVFHFREIDIKELKEYLKNKGIKIR